jgi:hypothetical protein
MSAGEMISICISMVLSGWITAVLCRHTSKTNAKLREAAISSIECGSGPDWTKPRAYIVRMQGKQASIIARAAQIRAEQLYAAYVDELRKKHGI